MAYRADIQLGRITKVHGFEGGVTVRLEKTFIENIPEMESVFIEIEGKPVPFLISESDYPGGDIIWLKFTGYESIENISEFTGCRVFLTGSATENKTETLTGKLIGYKLQSPDNKLYGIIAEVIENPGQYLLKIITTEQKPLLVPFHEDLIVKINRKKKLIIMDLPEGLTDLN